MFSNKLWQNTKPVYFIIVLKYTNQLIVSLCGAPYSGGVWTFFIFIAQKDELVKCKLHTGQKQLCWKHLTANRQRDRESHCWSES